MIHPARKPANWMVTAMVTDGAVLGRRHLDVRVVAGAPQPTPDQGVLGRRLDPYPAAHVDRSDVDMEVPFLRAVGVSGDEIEPAEGAHDREDHVGVDRHLRDLINGSTDQRGPGDRTHQPTTGITVLAARLDSATCITDVTYP